MRLWDQEDLYYITKTCIILDNMIIEDQCGNDTGNEINELLRDREIEVLRERIDVLANFLTRD